MDETKLKAKILHQWNVPELVSDLRTVKWFATESHRIDRRAWLGSYDLVRGLARDAFPSKEWREAAADGFEDELVDEYMEALAEVVSEATGGELRREHVYATFEDGEAWIGQYEDMSADELEAMGFEVDR